MNQSSHVHSIKDMEDKQDKWMTAICENTSFDSIKEKMIHKTNDGSPYANHYNY